MPSMQMRSVDSQSAHEPWHPMRVMAYEASSKLSLHCSCRQRSSGALPRSWTERLEKC